MSAWIMQFATVRNGPTAQTIPVFVTDGLADHWKTHDPAILNVVAAEHALRSLTAVYMANMAGEYVDANKRCGVAVHLATARLAQTATFGLARTDSITSQIAGGASALNVTIAAGGVITPGVGNATDPALYAAQLAIYDVNVAANADVGVYLKRVAMVSRGIPIVQGVTLVKTDVHHFVEPHKQFHRAIGNQVFPEGWAPMLTLTMEEFEDVVYHKSAHHIKSGLMTGWARSASMKQAFVLLNLSAAVVRVPARTDIEEAQSAELRTLRAVQSAAETANVNLGRGLFAITARNTALTQAIQAAATPVDRINLTIAAEVTMETTAADCAFAFGMYMRTLENNKPPGETLSNSKYLGRIQTEYHNNFFDGFTALDNGLKWTRAQIKNGTLPGSGIYGAAAAQPKVGEEP